MQKKLLMTGVAASLTVYIVSALSTSQASQQAELGANSLSNGDLNKSLVAQTAPSAAPDGDVIKVGERQSQVDETTSSEGTTSETKSKSSKSKDVIAKVHTHEISGRKAVTLYVRNIPAVTFLGDKPGSAKTPEVKVASAGKQSGDQQSDYGDANWQDPVWRATTVSAKINQLHQSGVDADDIRVKWDKERQNYIIQVKEDQLLEMGQQTILPKTTRDVAEDALQITNLLRRQMGNAGPLSEIAGRPKPKPSQTVALGPVRFRVTGMASWYGPGFHGNLTANGERYNQYALTAAHKSLPFGTRVRVTNMNNGRSVLVRINDRGPYIHGRVIDLSQGAAQVIGVTSSGVAPISMEVLQ